MKEEGQYLGLNVEVRMGMGRCGEDDVENGLTKTCM